MHVSNIILADLYPIFDHNGLLYANVSDTLMIGKICKGISPLLNINLQPLKIPCQLQLSNVGPLPAISFRSWTFADILTKVKLKIQPPARYTTAIFTYPKKKYLSYRDWVSHTCKSNLCHHGFSWWHCSAHPNKIRFLCLGRQEIHFIYIWSKVFVL